MRTDKTYYTEGEIENELGSDGPSVDDLKDTGSLQDSSSEDSSKNRKSDRRRRQIAAGKGRSGRMSGGRNRRSIKKTVLIVICCILILALSVAGLAYGILKNKLDALEHDTSIDTSELCIDSKVARELADYQNIALLGIDNRVGENIDECRSDAMVIASINKKTKEVKIFSLMRDSYLQLDEAGQLVIDKLTHAHAYGGPKGTMRALNRNLDLNVTDYVRVDWKAVADTVDSMGGLVLNVDEKNIDELNKCIASTNSNLRLSSKKVTKAGRQTLNGVQTVAFCRIRHIDGDNHRAMRIREVISAAAEKTKHMSLGEINNVANKALPEIKTSLTSSAIMGILLHINSYDVENEKGWPYEFYDGLLGEVSYTVPITLSSNVSEMHKLLFGQDDYQVSDTVAEISSLVSEKSGFYEKDNNTITSEDVDN